MSKAITKQCWKNSLDALSDYPGSEYIEGWAVTKPSYLAIEHGWLELDGKVIDPTIPDKAIKYFPVLRFNAGEAWTLAREIGSVPLIWEMPERWDEYRQAQEEAIAFCGPYLKSLM